jgi:hypothetical protein
MHKVVTATESDGFFKVRVLFAYGRNIDGQLEFIL